MSSKVKLLSDELDQITQKRQILRSKHAGSTMPAEATAEDEQLHERALKVREAIEQEKVRARDADFDDLLHYQNDPSYRIPVGAHVNSDDSGRKTIESAGWKIKSGVIVRETSLGDYPMYEEEVLFGPLPENSSEREFYTLTRAAIQPEYRDAYVKFIKLVARTGEKSTALSMMSGAEQKALSEGLDTAGGYLVPPDVQAEIFARTAQQAVIRQLARVINTSRDRVMWPRVEPASASTGSPPGNTGGGSIFSSAFVGTWFGESASQNDIDPVFGTVDIGIRKIRCSTKMSNDFISDAVTNIPAFLATDGGRNMALVEDNGFLRGQQLGNPSLEPNGLLSETALQAGGASAVLIEDSSTANNIANAGYAAGTGSAGRIIGLAYALPAQYVQGASWVCRRSVEGKIRALQDGQGRFLWPPAIASGFAAVTRELLGMPIYNSDFVPADGTDTNQVLILGDWSAYIIAQRAQITSTVLRERYADTDQTGIILWERVGGGLTNPDAFRVGVV